MIYLWLARNKWPKHKRWEINKLKYINNFYVVFFSTRSDSKYIYNMQGNPLKREAVISIKLNRIGGLLTKILPLPTNEQESILCIWNHSTFGGILLLRLFISCDECYVLDVFLYCKLRTNIMSSLKKNLIWENALKY